MSCCPALSDIDTTSRDFGRVLAVRGGHEVARTIVPLSKIAEGGKGRAKSVKTVCVVNNEWSFHGDERYPLSEMVRMYDCTPGCHAGKEEEGEKRGRGDRLYHSPGRGKVAFIQKVSNDTQVFRRKVQEL